MEILPWEHHGQSTLQSLGYHSFLPMNRLIHYINLAKCWSIPIWTIFGLVSFSKILKPAVWGKRSGHVVETLQCFEEWISQKMGFAANTNKTKVYQITVLYKYIIIYNLYVYIYNSYKEFIFIIHIFIIHIYIYIYNIYIHNSCIYIIHIYFILYSYIYIYIIHIYIYIYINT